jgi:hypothetical protein
VIVFYPRHFYHLHKNVTPFFCPLPPLATAQQRLTIATVDSQATKGDEAWSEDEERELLRIVNDDEYRKVRCRSGCPHRE